MGLRDFSALRACHGASRRECGVMVRNAMVLTLAGILATPAAATELSQIVGLWQFPGKAVWIHIKDDGSTFQCRIPKEGSVITAAGKFKPPGAIAWNRFWGTEEIQYRSGRLVIHANKVDKDFTYVRAKGAMASACKAHP